MRVCGALVISVSTILENLALTPMNRRGFLAERNVDVSVKG